MQSAQHPRLLRWLPSMTDAAFIMPLVFLFCGMHGAKTLLGDGDTGWHLRTGEWILANGRVPDRDIFSFTRPGQPWFAWEWLWDVLFGWLHSHFGLAVVVLASSLILALTFALVFRMACRSSDALVALVLTLIAAAGSAGHWLARPHLVTMLFTVIFYRILDSSRTRRRSEGEFPRRLWGLPLLMVLWTNLHGGFFVGILMVAVYAAEELAVCLRESTRPDRLDALRRGRRYLTVAAACCLATFANPYGYKLHAHIVAYLADGFYRGNIMEFQPLNFQSPQARYFEFLLAVGAAAAFQHLRRGRFVWPLLFAVWAHGALYSARNVEIFVLLAVAPASEIVSEGLRKASAARLSGWLRTGMAELSDFTREWNTFDGEHRWNILSVAAMLMLAAMLGASHTPPAFRAAYDPKSFPVAAAGQLEKAKLLGGLFTEDLWGGYLIYREYPRGRVFIDGRSDFYGAEFAGRYMKAMGAQSGWDRYLSGYRVETVLLPPDAPLAGALRESPAWSLAYDDGVALIFRLSRSVPAPARRAAAVAGGNARVLAELDGTKSSQPRLF